LFAKNPIFTRLIPAYDEHFPTQIKAHPRFQLFAAQNPAGVYGGRKQLSRAFTNRFVQMEFQELPDDELEIIVAQKCKLPPSKAKLLVKVGAILFVCLQDLMQEKCKQFLKHIYREIFLKSSRLSYLTAISKFLFFSKIWIFKPKLWIKQTNIKLEMNWFFFLKF